MKNFIKIASALFFLSILAGCSSSDGEVCTAVEGVTCVSGGTVDACCTDSSCRYVLDGVSYPCNGIDCDAAAATVVDICLSGSAKASDISYTKLFEDLLIEKSDNINLRFEVGKTYSGE